MIEDLIAFVEKCMLTIDSGRRVDCTRLSPIDEAAAKASVDPTVWKG